MNKTILFLVFLIPVLLVGSIRDSQKADFSGDSVYPSAVAGTLNISGSSLMIKDYLPAKFKLPFAYHDIGITNAFYRLVLRQAPLPADKMNLTLLLDTRQQPCWMNPCEVFGQTLVLKRTGYKAKLAIQKSQKLAQYDRQTGLNNPTPFSRNLHESSPRGFFLLI